MGMQMWSATQASPSFHCSKRSVLLVFHKEVKQNAKKSQPIQEHEKVNIW